MRDPDNELRVEAMPELRRPVLDRLVSGLERRRARRVDGRRVPRARRWKRRAVRGHRPGALLRLRLDAAAGLARRGERCGGSTGPRTRSTTRASSTRRRTPCCCSAASRACAGARSARSSPASRSDLGVELVVTLGSLLADVTHTRPAPVTASASDPSLVERLGVQPSRYEGPTGIVGVLHDACRAAGIPSVSLWAAVPHYVSMTPSPPRGQGALRPACDPDRRPDRHERARRRRASSTCEQVSEAVAADEDTAAYVEELESRADELDRRERPAVGRRARRRADALPARARAGRATTTPRSPATATTERRRLAEGERVRLHAGREAQLEQRVRRAPATRAACRAGSRRRAPSSSACRRRGHRRRPCRRARGRRRSPGSAAAASRRRPRRSARPRRATCRRRRAVAARGFAGNA